MSKKKKKRFAPGAWPELCFTELKNKTIFRAHFCAKGQQAYALQIPLCHYDFLMSFWFQPEHKNRYKNRLFWADTSIMLQHKYINMSLAHPLLSITLMSCWSYLFIYLSQSCISWRSLRCLLCINYSSPFDLHLASRFPSSALCSWSLKRMTHFPETVKDPEHREQLCQLLLFKQEESLSVTIYLFITMFLE